MTDEKRVSDDKLREIIAGCDGVTPGPWATDDPWIVYSAADGDILYLADTEDLDTSDEQMVIDAAHIARLDPQTVTAICEELLARRSHQGSYRLVPEEPTEAMVRAMGDAFLDAAIGHEAGDLANVNAPFRRFYRAMLAKAPSPKKRK